MTRFVQIEVPTSNGEMVAMKRRNCLDDLSEWTSGVDGYERAHHTHTNMCTHLQHMHTNMCTHLQLHAHAHTHTYTHTGPRLPVVLPLKATTSPLRSHAAHSEEIQHDVKTVHVAVTHPGVEHGLGTPRDEFRLSKRGQIAFDWSEWQNNTTLMANTTH